MTDAATELAALLRAGGRIDPDAMDRLYDGLPPVDCAHMLGAWKGADIDTGHPVSRQLGAMNWYGKTFHSVDHVDPLICRDAGGALFADRTSMGGGATLRMDEFRGVSSATMVYDARPVRDHFRQLDDHRVVGVMNGENVTSRGRHYYFLLERAAG